MNLNFSVKNQFLKKDDNYIVADSENYLKATFTFSEDWDGFAKTVKFKKGTNVYDVVLVNNSCVVPWEVIKTPSFYVSVSGVKNDVVITTNIATVPVKASGYVAGVTPSPTTPSSRLIPEGGTEGQVLAKASNTDYDTEWVNQTGGSGGTNNYNDLNNKPSINSVTLSGNKTSSDLGLAPVNHNHSGVYQPVEAGKGLSTNDFTGALKTKLEGISEGAEVNVQSDWSQTDTSADDYIKNKPTIPTLPAATEAGTAIIWNGQEWEAVSGYAGHKVGTLYEGTVTVQYGSGSISPIEFIIGETYDVTINGTKYENLEAFAYSWAVCIGDLNLTTYPFALANNGELMMLTDGEYTVKIEGTANTILDINLTNLNVKNGTGSYSVVEGYGTTASGSASHAEGEATQATEAGSHAEGVSSKATGLRSHAEGWVTEASGSASHSEGCNSIASGSASHSEGLYTLASSDYQHVQGKYNVQDSNSTYVDIIGWGTGNSNRKNIEVTTTTGDKRLKGNIYVGCNDDSTGGSKLATEAFVTSHHDSTKQDTLIAGTNITIAADGKTISASGGSSYTLPTASSSTLGGVKVGNNLSIDANGVLNFTHQDISGKENTSNKVTSISSSSTDTQYPSAKCVYDLIGDVETLLGGLL